jgi:hypothetical protein
MHYAEFARRFRDHQEIGREGNQTHLLVFYDNGREVGLWCQDRRTTFGSGKLLKPQDADLVRYWYRNGVYKWAEALLQYPRVSDLSPAWLPRFLQ